MTDDFENTAENTADKRLANLKKGRAFVKGFDPRRNIKGVPRDAVLMRQHMRKIAAELIGKDETEMTRLDAMLRQFFTSRNPAHNKLALQVLNPKILQEVVDLTNSDGTWKPKEDDARFERAISTLADALREIVPGKGAGGNSKVDASK
jgi:hypothetical protein